MDIRFYFPNGNNESTAPLTVVVPLSAVEDIIENFELYNNNKIPMIKALRTRFHLDLRAAKDIIDFIFGYAESRQRFRAIKSPTNMIDHIVWNTMHAD